jgi:hypothetical protein
MNEKMPRLDSMLVTFALGAVVVVLCAGLVNMLVEGSPSRSQQLMRWRVGLQFLAIALVMGVLWLRS